MESTWSVGVSGGSNYYNLERSVIDYHSYYPNDYLDHDCRGHNSALPGWNVSIEIRKKFGKYFSYATLFSFDEVPGKHWLEDQSFNFSLPPGAYSVIHTYSRFLGNHQFLYYRYDGKKVTYHVGLGVVGLFHKGTRAYIQVVDETRPLYSVHPKVILMPGLAVAVDYKLNNRFSVYAAAHARGSSLRKEDIYKGVLLAMNVGLRYHVPSARTSFAVDSLCKSLFPKFIIYAALGVGGNIGPKMTEGYSDSFARTWYSDIKEVPEPSLGIGMLVKFATIGRFSLQLGAELEQISYHGTIHARHKLDLDVIPIQHSVESVNLSYSFKEYLVNAPLLVNYRLKQNEKHYFGAKAGVAYVYNFMGIEYFPNYYSFPGPRYGYGPLAGITYAKNLGKHMNFVLEPLMKCYILSPTYFDGRMILLSGALKVGIGFH